MPRAARGVGGRLGGPAAAAPGGLRARGRDGLQRRLPRGRRAHAVVREGARRARERLRPARARAPAHRPVAGLPLRRGSGASRMTTQLPDRHRDVTLVELVDRLLGQGVVISGEITLAVADIDLVNLELRALIASTDTIARRVP